MGKKLSRKQRKDIRQKALRQGKPIPPEVAPPRKVAVPEPSAARASHDDGRDSADPVASVLGGSRAKKLARRKRTERALIGLLLGVLALASLVAYVQLRSPSKSDATSTADTAAAAATQTPEAPRPLLAPPIDSSPPTIVLPVTGAVPVVPPPAVVPAATAAPSAKATTAPAAPKATSAPAAPKATSAPAAPKPAAPKPSKGSSDPY